MANSGADVASLSGVVREIRDRETFAMQADGVVKAGSLSGAVLTVRGDSNTDVEGYLVGGRGVRHARLAVGLPVHVTIETPARSDGTYHLRRLLLAGR